MSDIAKNASYVLESPFVFWAGETAWFDVNYLGEGTLTSATNELYRNKEDVSATYLSGSAVIAGRTITTKTATFTLAGEYELYTNVTDGGITRTDAIRIFVRKKGVY